MTERAAAARRYLPGGSSWMWTLPPDLAFVVERGQGSQIVDTETDLAATLAAFEEALAASA